MDDRDALYDRLIKLGDLMGDGEHLEPSGEWIEREYKQVMRLLGLLPKKSVHRDSKSIDEFMSKRVLAVKCECGGELKQTRKGSFIAKCVVCEKKYKLGSKRR